jgi:hypothetical protein
MCAADHAAAGDAPTMADDSFADQPVKGLFDCDVAQWLAIRIGEHRVISGAGAAALQVALQTCRRRIVQRHKTGLPELGLADQQTVARYVGEREIEGFGDAQPRGRE